MSHSKKFPQPAGRAGATRWLRLPHHLTRAMDNGLTQEQASTYTRAIRGVARDLGVIQGNASRLIPKTNGFPSLSKSRSGRERLQERARRPKH